MSAPAVRPAAPPVPRQRRRWLWGVAAGSATVGVLVPLATAAGGWYFSNQVLRLSRHVRYPVRVRAVDEHTVTISRNYDTIRGEWLGLTWRDGHAVLGEILHEDRTTIVRRLRSVSRGELRPGTAAYANSYVFDGDPKSTRGLDYRDVVLTSEAGDHPAWLVPPTSAESGTWVIAVHGRGASRTEALRALPTLAAGGHTTLVITYRNDQEAVVPTADGFSHLGDKEWAEVAAALRYARDHGAKRIVLYGWSLGGAIVMTALRRMPPTEAATVTAVVLDCPVMDWVATLALQARKRRLPPVVTWTVSRLIEWRTGICLGELDQCRYELTVPMLIFLDGDDLMVDPEPTRAFAEARPGAVRLVETRGGGHCRSWNMDPDRYEDELRRFLDRG